MDFNNQRKETVKDSSALGRVFRMNNSFKPLLLGAVGEEGIYAVMFGVATFGYMSLAVRNIHMSFYKMMLCLPHDLFTIVYLLSL